MKDKKYIWAWSCHGGVHLNLANNLKDIISEVFASEFDEDVGHVFIINKVNGRFYIEHTNLIHDDGQHIVVDIECEPYEVAKYLEDFAYKYTNTSQYHNIKYIELINHV